MCALLVRKPVRIALTMDEQFYTITKHGATVRIKTGVTKDGRITARQVETFWNGGAYADIGPRVTQKSGFTAAGPYDIEHVHIDSYALYTNLPPAGALRGFGIPQLVWAYESHADMIARALGMDAVEFRRRNILHEGRPQATGTPMRDAAIDRVLERVAALRHAIIATGLKSPLASDIRTEIWVKLWGNVAFNPISALTHATLAELLRYPLTRELCYDLMREAEAVAGKLGVRFRVGMDRRIAGAEQVGEHKTSMLQDLEAGKPLELEALVGAVIELARLTETPTPHLDAVYACTSLLARTLADHRARLVLS